MAYLGGVSDYRTVSAIFGSLGGFEEAFLVSRAAVGAVLGSPLSLRELGNGDVGFRLLVDGALTLSVVAGRELLQGRRSQQFTHGLEVASLLLLLSVRQVLRPVLV